MNQTTLIIACLISTVIVSSVISISISSIIAKKRSYKQINQVLKKTRKIKSYKQLAEITAAITEQNNEEHTTIMEKIQQIFIEKKRNVKKISSRKYDSTPDSGGQMSFSVALLNEENTGIMLTNIYMREGSFLYLREIVNGKCDIELSEEEKEVLKKTINVKNI